MEPKPLHPGIRKAWLTLALPPAAFAGLAAIQLTRPLDMPIGFGVVVAVALLALAVGVPNRLYKRWRYAIRDRDVYTSRGAIWHLETLIPFDRIQFVESRQGPLDRMYGLTQVLIYTAAGRAGRIPGLDSATAESLREELSTIAGAPSV
ncbi:MAG: PH domain-containing protein [Actinomycetota bacterium]